LSVYIKIRTEKRDAITENVTDKIKIINITVLATVIIVLDVETFRPMISIITAQASGLVLGIEHSIKLPLPLLHTQRGGRAAYEHGIFED
jgi:hypothetical protein